MNDGKRRDADTRAMVAATQAKSLLVKDLRDGDRGRGYLDLLGALALLSGIPRPDSRRPFL
jgi:hypothetical protein